MPSSVDFYLVLFSLKESLCFIYLFAYLVCVYVPTYIHMQVHATAWVWRSEDYLWEVLRQGLSLLPNFTDLASMAASILQGSWMLFLELDHKVKCVAGLKPRSLCLCG